jgi:hypothetical protein
VSHEVAGNHCLEGEDLDPIRAEAAHCTWPTEVVADPSTIVVIVVDSPVKRNSESSPRLTGARGGESSPLFFARRACTACT